jgi:hypothetical protein
MRRTIVLLAAAVLFGRAAEASTSTETLTAACGETTKVVKTVGDDARIVGEKLGGFCKGFLQGTFDLLALEGGVCNKEDAPSPEYLLSVLRTYVKDNPARAKGPAAPVARDAFRRAFPCEKSKTSR